MVRHKVVDGPDWDRMINILDNMKDEGVDAEQGFLVVLQDKNVRHRSIDVRNMHITKMMYEDASREGFWMTGQCEISNFVGGYGDCDFECYYNAKNKSGWIQFKEKLPQKILG